jgi:hypothetical protein
MRTQLDSSLHQLGTQQVLFCRLNEFKLFIVDIGCIDLLPSPNRSAMPASFCGLRAASFETSGPKELVNDERLCPRIAHPGIPADL